MIRIFEKPKLPDWWALHPSEDPRFNGLLDLSNGIVDIFEFAAGTSDDDLVLAPSELARCLRQAAEEIELWTDFSVGRDAGGTLGEL